MEALKKLSSPHAKVRRDGAMHPRYPRQDLVPGDVVRAGGGRLCVPPDLAADRIGRVCSVDESALTGESEPVEKHAETLAQEGDASPGRSDQTSPYSGSLVTYGRGDRNRCHGHRDGHAARALSPACWVGERGRGDAPAAPHGRPGQEAGAAVHWRYACWSLWQWVAYGNGMRARCFMTAISLAVAAIPEGHAGHCDHRAGHRRAAA